MTAPEPAVLTRYQGPVAYLVLNRPYARNAVTVALGAELHDALTKAARRARVIVIEGAGGHFCAGGDFQEVSRLRAEGAEALRPLFANFRRACELIATLPIPVLAKVRGYAMAGGFELVQSCDIAIVARDAVLADNHANFGQVPGGGGSQRLPRLVGRQRALGHILTGDRLSGDEAVAWGLAYRAVAPENLDAEAAALAEKLAAKDPAATARTKRLIHAGLAGTLPEGLDLELSAVLEHLGSRNAEDGITAFTRRTRREGRST